MTLSKQLYIFLITVLAIVVYIQWEEGKKTNHIVNMTNTADTVVILKTDTIKEYVFKEIEKKTVDTVYIETQNKPFVALPIVSKHFAKENLYDAWVSGVEPLKIDSIRVYPTTEYKTIENINAVKVYEPKTQVFVNAGFSSFDGFFVPKVGISIKNKKEWLYGLEIGKYGDDMYYGVNIGIKINK